MSNSFTVLGYPLKGALDLTVRLKKSHVSLKHWSVMTINYRYVAVTKHATTAITYTAILNCSRFFLHKLTMFQNYTLK